MDDLDSLRRQFAIPGVAELSAGQNNLPGLAIRTPAATAEIYLHGAHVTQFQPVGQKPVLFLSAESLFQPGKAIRGGVPLIFPWFGPNSANPALPAHGFARTNPWRLASLKQVSADAVEVEMQLLPSDATRKLWPYEFAARYTVTIGRTLDLQLVIHNTGSSSFTFEEAFHTYLTVGDVRQVKVEGLADRPYLDQTQARRRMVQGPEPITIGGEVDRLYLATPDTVKVVDPAGGRTLTVSKRGSRATVVWNPWIAKSKALADFGDDEWPQMICIESANAVDEAITLAPGQEHVMTATIGA